MKKTDIYNYIASRLKEFRETFGGKGISQDQLAKHLDVTPNTISRWETGVYKPKVDDLEKLANFFSKKISDFLPPEERPSNDSKLVALFNATSDLAKEDIEILTEFALYRKTRTILKEANKKKRKKENVDK